MAYNQLSKRAASARRIAAEAQLAIDIDQPREAHIDAMQGVLQLASVATLVGFLRTGIDARALLAQQLADRGLNQDGIWVGFEEAYRLFLAEYPGARDAGICP